MDGKDDTLGAVVGKTVGRTTGTMLGAIDGEDDGCAGKVGSSDEATEGS